MLKVMPRPQTRGMIRLQAAAMRWPQLIVFVLSMCSMEVQALSLVEGSLKVQMG